MSDDKEYHIYLKDGGKLTTNNFFSFYEYQEKFSDTVLRLTVEEPWIDVQKECMEKLKTINLVGDEK